MGVAKKRRAKLVIGDRLFVWFVCDGEEGVSSWGPILHVASEDKQFLTHFALGQPDPPFVIVLGREFPGLPDAGGCWIRVRCPRFGEESSITPGFVRRLIDWCLAPEKDILRVECDGKPVVQSNG